MMGCVFHGYGKDDEACAITGRVQEITKSAISTDCPHKGEGSRCEFIRAKLAESNEVL